MRPNFSLRLHLLISLFLALWAFPFPLDSLPVLILIGAPLKDLLNNVVLFFGNHILSLEEPLQIKLSGSGDKMIDYVNLLWVFIVSFLVWVSLQLLTKKSKQSKVFNAINKFTSIYVRYYLALILISYGLSKVFILQFQPPSYVRLLTEFGNMSPMGLVWGFMGYSEGYTFMSGFLEFLGGILLFNKRTIHLGCLIILGVMGNVVPLNFFYDVPVKLYSVRYFVMALYIIWPSLHILIKAIFTKYPITFHYFKNRKLGKYQNRLKISKYVILSVFIGYSLFETYRSLEQYGTSAPKSPLEGLYTVDVFKRNGDIIPPLLTDGSRMRYLVFEIPIYSTIYNMEKERTFYKTELDSLKKELVLKSYNDTTDVYRFNYSSFAPIIYSS